MRRGIWITAAVAATGLATAALWIYWGLTHAADTAEYAAISPRPAGTRAQVKATFLGVSTILLDDGETQIMTDGFLSRPAARELFAKHIDSDTGAIARHLARAGVTRLAALVVTHSHYDHAMDTAAVANLTGAVIVGSDSTANIARGGDVPEARIVTPAIGEARMFGAFKVTLLASAHVPSGYPQGSIDAPLRQPARADAYKLGRAYVVLIEHHGRKLLVNASAGFERGALQTTQAETVFLGIGQLGKQSEAYRADYWGNVVSAVGAKRVLAIHWDNFTLPLDEPAKPLPKLFDNMDVSVADLKRKGQAEGRAIMIAFPWQSFDPFDP